MCRPYRRLVDRLRAQALPCWICGHNINYKPYGRRHPLAFTLDDETPLSKGGDLLDPATPVAHTDAATASGGRCR